MRKYLIITLLSFPLLFSGCSGFEEIKILNVKDVTYQEFKGNVLQLSLVVTVDNPNRFNVKIRNAVMDLRLNEQVLGSVTQMEQITLAGRTQKDYKIHVSIEMKDMLTNMLNLFRVLMNEPRNLNLSGTVQVKSILYSKTYHVDRLSFQ